MMPRLFTEYCVYVQTIRTFCLDEGVFSLSFRSKDQLWALEKTCPSQPPKITVSTVIDEEFIDFMCF